MYGVSICRNADGETVAEVDLDETDLTVPEILEAARAADVALVWAYARHRPSPEFTETSGYKLLRAETLAHTHDPLPQIDRQLYGPLLAEAYRGQWGHKWVEQPQHTPVDGSVVLCLSEADNPVGLCRVWPETRRADAPGLVPSIALSTATFVSCVVPAWSWGRVRGRWSAGARHPTPSGPTRNTSASRSLTNAPVGNSAFKEMSG